MDTYFLSHISLLLINLLSSQFHARLKPLYSCLQPISPVTLPWCLYYPPRYSLPILVVLSFYPQTPSSPIHLSFYMSSSLTTLSFYYELHYCPLKLTTLIIFLITLTTCHALTYFILFFFYNLYTICHPTSQLHLSLFLLFVLSRIPVLSRSYHPLLCLLHNQSHLGFLPLFWTHAEVTVPYALSMVAKPQFFSFRFLYSTPTPNLISLLPSFYIGLWRLTLSYFSISTQNITLFFYFTLFYAL